VSQVRPTMLPVSVYHVHDITVHMYLNRTVWNIYLPPFAICTTIQNWYQYVYYL